MPQEEYFTGFKDELDTMFDRLSHTKNGTQPSSSSKPAGASGASSNATVQESLSKHTHQVFKEDLSTLLSLSIERTL